MKSSPHDKNKEIIDIINIGLKQEEVLKYYLIFCLLFIIILFELLI